MAKLKQVSVHVSSSTIEALGTLYPIKQIAGVKKVYVKPSEWWKKIFIKTRHAILIKTAGDGYIVLVVTLDEPKIEDLFGKIREAIEANSRGNHTYVSQVHVTGDIVNQSGNFGTGFNKGVIDLTNPN